MASEVQVWSQSSSTWIDQPALTNQTSFEIGMLALGQAPYGYVQGQKVQVQVRSAN